MNVDLDNLSPEALLPHPTRNSARTQLANSIHEETKPALAPVRQLRRRAW